MKQRIAKTGKFVLLRAIDKGGRLAGWLVVNYAEWQLLDTDVVVKLFHYNQQRQMPLVRVSNLYAVDSYAYITRSLLSCYHTCVLRISFIMW